MIENKTTFERYGLQRTASSSVISQSQSRNSSLSSQQHRTTTLTEELVKILLNLENEAHR